MSCGGVVHKKVGPLNMWVVLAGMQRIRSADLIRNLISDLMGDRILRPNLNRGT
jgi:hypothetical protein